MVQYKASSEQHHIHSDIPNVAVTFSWLPLILLTFGTLSVGLFILWIINYIRYVFSTGRVFLPKTNDNDNNNNGNNGKKQRRKNKIKRRGRKKRYNESDDDDDDDEDDESDYDDDYDDDYD